MILCGGDFDSFQVTIADAVYNDPALGKDLTTKGPCPQVCRHGHRQEEQEALRRVRDDRHDAAEAPRLIRGHGPLRIKSYAEVINSSGTDNDWYDKGKRGVFGRVYGGDWNTLVQKLGVTEARAKAAYADFGDA